MNDNKTNVRLQLEKAIKDTEKRVNDDFFSLYNQKTKLYGNGQYSTVVVNHPVFVGDRELRKLKEQYYKMCLIHIHDDVFGDFDFFDGDLSLLGDLSDFSNTPVTSSEASPALDPDFYFRPCCRFLSQSELDKLPSDTPDLPWFAHYRFIDGVLCSCIQVSNRTSIKLRVLATYEELTNKPIKSIDVDPTEIEIVSAALLALDNDQLTIVKDGSIVDKSKRNRCRAFKRAKDKIFDIGMSNDWSYFVTLTFDDTKTGENTVKNLCKKVQKWLDNMVQRKSLKFLLVAEYSPKNHRIHFHGFFNDVLDMVDSGKVKAPFKGCKGMSAESAVKHGFKLEDCKTIYNISDWRFGFSTAVNLDGDPINCVRYIYKYITKDTDLIFGRYYWSSRNVVRDVPCVYDRVSFDDFKGDVFGDQYLKFKYDCSFRVKSDA